MLRVKWVIRRTTPPVRSRGQVARVHGQCDFTSTSFYSGFPSSISWVCKLLNRLEKKVGSESCPSRSTPQSWGLEEGTTPSRLQSSYQSSAPVRPPRNPIYFWSLNCISSHWKFLFIPTTAPDLGSWKCQCPLGQVMQVKPSSPTSQSPLTPHLINLKYPNYICRRSHDDMSRRGSNISKSWKISKKILIGDPSVIHMQCLSPLYLLELLTILLSQ